LLILNVTLVFGSTAQFILACCFNPISTQLPAPCLVGLSKDTPYLN